MQYTNKYATEDQITKHFKYKETVGDAYFDEHGILKPGHCNKFEIGHFAILALMEWGQQNTYVKEKMYEKHRLRFITCHTIFEYEVQTLVAMMHWDEFNKTFKLIVLNNSLKKKGTSFKEQCKKAELMKKEQDRLFDIGEVKVRLRKMSGRWCWNFLAAIHIQRWWLRKKRKFRIYKNIYQLMDEYSVPGGFTEQDSAKYLGVGKNLLKIQEDIMKKVEMRRVKCRELSKKFIGTVFKGVIDRKFNRYGETVYGGGPSSRWAEDGGTEPYLCAPCATTDRSYPGGGRASGNLNHPRWAAQCWKCGKKNQYYKYFSKKYYEMLAMRLPSAPTHTPYFGNKKFVEDYDGWREMSPSPPPVPPAPPPSPCDEGPVGDEGPKSWRGAWSRRLGLTK